MQIISIITICIALLLSITIGVFALFRSFGSGKNYFLLMQTLVIIFLFGYLLEITSTNADEAFTAVKVLYVGPSIPAFAFFFVTDYCKMKLHPLFVKTPMVLIPLAILILMWTTDIHHLFYLSYGFDTVYGQGLIANPGPLYPLVRFYSLGCLILSMAVVLYHVAKWKNKYRRQLLILFVCLTIPFASEAIYHVINVTGMLNFKIYLTPYSMSLMSFCLYLGVMRYNIFEIISTATLTAMDYISEGFVLLDEQNNFLSSNSAAVDVFPEIKNLVKGESIYFVSNWPEELKGVETGTVRFSLNFEKIKHFDASLSPVSSSNKLLNAKIILFRDITDSVNLVKELENAANTDALTGVYNRKHFSDLARTEIDRFHRMNQPIYAAMLDIDFFKKVNDTYGHAAGDQVLIMMAETIRQTIRPYDLFCRYGGEEFVLLIAGSEIPDVCKLMERIRKNTENSVTTYESEEIRVSCSIGLAKFCDADTLDSLIKKADQALYAAKNAGRNQVRMYTDV